MKYDETEEFKKDFKKLLKRYKTLEEDFARMKKASVELFHIHKINNRQCFEIKEFCTDEYMFYKVKKFACKALQGGVDCGLRAIYVYQEKLSLITFIEIYYKGDKANNNYDRLKKFLKGLE